MKVGKELAIENLNNLRDKDKIVLELLDKDEFSIEDINKPFKLAYNSLYETFSDEEECYNEWNLDEIKGYLSCGQLKVYEYILTNYERIKNMTIEEMAKSRVKYVENDDAYMGDFSVEDSRSDYVYREEEALKREIAWLNSEVE